MTAEKIRAMLISDRPTAELVNVFLCEIAAQLAEANQMQREQIQSAAAMVEAFEQARAANPVADPPLRERPVHGMRR